MSDLWHGWTRGDSDALHIGVLPGRKHPCLYVIRGSVLTVLAHFKGADEAKDALLLLDQLVGVDA